VKKRAGTGTETPFRARDGFSIAGAMVTVVVALAGCLLVMGHGSRSRAKRRPF
jgi:hypothetical protein